MNKKLQFTLILSLILGLSLHIFLIFYLTASLTLIIVFHTSLGVINILLILGIIFNSLHKPKIKKTTGTILNFKNIINSLSEGVMIIDDNNVIKLFNPEAEKITGFSKEEIVNIDYSMFFKIVNSDGSPVEDMLDPIKNSIRANQEIKSKEYSIMTASHQVIPVSITSIPIPENRAILITFKNIAKELDEEREQIEFISTASHEMRTPIASIEGYLGLASNPKTATVDERAEKYIKKAQASVQHLGILFRNLLSITKAEDKRLKIEPKLIDLNEFLKQITSNYIELGSKKDLKIYFTHSGDSDQKAKTLMPNILVFTDPNILREIMSILIENAIKYTERGEIKIDLILNQQGNAQISISDTGIGIPPENISHLFQKFYRVDNTATREIGGTGLGLYLARKLTSNIQGQIWVQSQLNVGSTFFVSLPRVSVEEAKKIKETHDNTVMPDQSFSSPMSKYNKNTYGNNINKGV